MFAKKKPTVHITMIVIIDQTKANEAAPRKILAEYMSTLFLSDIHETDPPSVKKKYWQLSQAEGQCRCH